MRNKYIYKIWVNGSGILKDYNTEKSRSELDLKMAILDFWNDKQDFDFYLFTEKQNPITFSIKKHSVCGKCEYCVLKEYQNCDDYVIDGEVLQEITFNNNCEWNMYCNNVLEKCSKCGNDMIRLGKIDYLKVKLLTCMNCFKNRNK